MRLQQGEQGSPAHAGAFIAEQRAEFVCWEQFAHGTPSSVKSDAVSFSCGLSDDVRGELAVRGLPDGL